MKKKFKNMTLKERQDYWKSLSKERQSYLLERILTLIKDKYKEKVYEPSPSYAMTDREKRARGGWGNWTSH